ncbi:membrane associated protein-like protein, partial [Leptomonas seymouri]
MWGFLSDVRESVRQVIAPPPGASRSSGEGSASNSATGTSGTAVAGAELTNMNGAEETVSGLTTELFRLWGKVNKAAFQVLHEAIDGTVPPKEENTPPIFALSAEQRAALPTEELLKLLEDGITWTTDRACEALNEAEFLLSLGIEEQIAHTNDYVACYEWWNRTVSQRLITCQEIIQLRLEPSGATAEQRARVACLTKQMETIRRDSTQPLAAVAARGRLLKDERYDLLRSPSDTLPATAQHNAKTTESVYPHESAVDSPASLDTVQQSAPPKPYAPQFKPFHASQVTHDTAPGTRPSPYIPATISAQPPSLNITEEILQQSAATQQPKSIVEQHTEEEQARLEREAAEEQAQLEREAEA